MIGNAKRGFTLAQSNQWWWNTTKERCRVACSIFCLVEIRWLASPPCGGSVCCWRHTKMREENGSTIIGWTCKHFAKLDFWFRIPTRALLVALEKNRPEERWSMRAAAIPACKIRDASKEQPPKRLRCVSSQPWKSSTTYSVWMTRGVYHIWRTTLITPHIWLLCMSPVPKNTS